ncbi:MAG: AAA family ATPase [Candidatus Bathyarchaeia archaeon]
MNEKLVVSVSGKGGSGKTTVTALMLKHLIESGNIKILVIDADPATNLPDVLGITVKKTVGMVEDELRRKLERSEIPPTVTKKELLEGQIHSILVEAEGFDLLAMGRSEGEGCYCSVNYLLTSIIDSISRSYDLTLMDMEAGLEHVSRRTDRDVDVMLIVTDPSRMGFQTALRIRDLADEVHIGFKKVCLIGNQFPVEAEEKLRAKAAEVGLEFAGLIPRDDNVSSFNIAGKPLLDLPGDSPAFVAARKIARQIGLEPSRH